MALGTYDRLVELVGCTLELEQLTIGPAVYNPALTYTINNNNQMV